VGGENEDFLKQGNSPPKPSNGPKLERKQSQALLNQPLNAILKAFKYEAVEDKDEKEEPNVQLLPKRTASIFNMARLNSSKGSLRLLASNLAQQTKGSAMSEQDKQELQKDLEDDPAL
jgi:hypothetical protein